MANAGNLRDSTLQDVRFAIRQLQKSLGFTGTAVFTLALGMCASVAIFAFVDAALIKPLPYREADRLVGVFNSIALFPQSNLSYLDYLDWKQRNKVFQAFDVYQRNGFLVTTAQGAQPSRGARVSDGFFRTLGVEPMLGRNFYAGEDLPGAPRTVILSYAAWQKRYAGNKKVLGTTVTLNGDASVIIGVLPRDFEFAPAAPAEFWTTLHASGSCDLRRSCHNLYGVARLKDGETVQSALANTKLIAQQLEKQYPDSNLGQGAAVEDLTTVLVGNVRPILLLLLSGAGLLLLIASVNVASLLLVRAESRGREIAVRSALGASRGRLVRQFVAEGLVLVAAGSALGMAAASWAMQLLVKLIPADLAGRMPFLTHLGLNARVLAFAAVIALGAAVLFSLTPALRLFVPEIREGLAEGSRGSAGTTWRRLGSRLVVVELATAMVLLVGAGLLGKSLNRLLHVEIGIQPEHLVGLSVAAPPSSYGKDEQAIALARRIIGRIGSIPGVTSAAIATDLPVNGWGNTTWFRVMGRPWHGEHNEIAERDVSSGYFTTLGARLLRGRYFMENEDATKPKVAIVNRAMAAQYFPGEDALGKRISPLSTPPKPMEIVGIVENIKEGQLDSADLPALYLPFNQSTSTGFGLVVRTGRDEGSTIPAVTAALREMDPGIATLGAAAMSTRIHDSPAAYLHRSSAYLVGAFAAIALVLSVVGLYGVVAYSVSQRTREIGIRMALGADRGKVYGLVLKEAGWLTVTGIGIGLVCSVWTARLIRGLLFGVQSWDVPTLGGVAFVLSLAALFASYAPARRAASVNPVDALRAE